MVTKWYRELENKFPDIKHDTFIWIQQLRSYDLLLTKFSNSYYII